MLKDELNHLIKSYVNKFQDKHFTLTKWKDPIVGYANAEDLLFLKLKEVITKSHGHPKEFLKNANTVLVYFIPFKEHIVVSNQESNISSSEWANAYVETNNLIAELNAHLKKILIYKGFDTRKMPATHNFNEKELTSDWSHKHVGYIAGLGDFGLHRMLITDKGCCGRLGSIITSARIEPTKRSEKKYCLHYYNKSCSLCVEKCTFDALQHEYFDRKKCYEICLENAKICSDLGLVDVCGKCISVVPCSFKNPVPANHIISQ
jgi:epoxyqueuosine reductase QueG